VIGVHVPTPKIIEPLFSAFFDPVPFAGEGLAIPDSDVPPGKPIYWNGDFSRFNEWIPWLIKKHREGHYVAILIPRGDSEEIRTLTRYGIFWLIPSERFFETIRDVEIGILTGDGKSRKVFLVP
jgi:hypothetical protein